jgi:hypothetical protein
MDFIHLILCHERSVYTLAKDRPGAGSPLARRTPAAFPVCFAAAAALSDVEHASPPEYIDGSCWPVSNDEAPILGCTGFTVLYLATVCFD